MIFISLYVIISHKLLLQITYLLLIQENLSVLTIKLINSLYVCMPLYLLTVL